VAQIVSGLTDEVVDMDLELGLQTTYTPSRYEAGWLLDSLRGFYGEGLITDVLALIKGGKEASVYLCRAHPMTDMDLLAAKVYRPRMFRNLRNDAMYRRGRDILVSSGRPAGRDSGYIRRAIRNKSAFGQQAAHTSWLMHEFTALEHLYDAGAAVPRPISSSDNAILMSYHGDEGKAAPTLNTVSLERDEAVRLFNTVLRNVHLMLDLGLVHGDLSAYNILYWEPALGAAGEPEAEPPEITIIDFPQVVDLHANPRARIIFRRDITRTCEYFQRQGVRCNPAALTRDLWLTYVPDLHPDDRAADQSRLTAAEELAEEMLSGASAAA
jgi:RIO kinase 1